MLTIYKPGQGYWTRVISATAFGGVIAAFAYHLHGLVKVNPFFQEYWLDLALPLLVAAAAGYAVYWFCGLNPRTVDFLVATEGEMKKVSWSSRREVVGATKVVIGLMATMSIYIFVLDFVFQNLFTFLGIMSSTGSS